MKNDDIIENNKLIAEFLGWEKSEMKLFVPTVSTVYRTVEYYNGEKVVGSFTHPSSMKFHKSWDWLMPVVERIVNEFPEYDHHKVVERVLQALMTADINEIYSSVIEFIKWYSNERKKNDIIENNKLIAEFMGIKDSENRYSHESSEYYFEACELLFHYSWDWLMPVVEKVESMGYIVTITQNICTIKASVMGDTTLITRQTGNYGTPDTKIYNTWLALIDFIKWYKENTE